MPTNPPLKSRRTWEDYLGLALAVAIGLSPWFREEKLPTAAYPNAAIVGVALLLLAQFEIIRSSRWEEVGELAGGIWVAASPFVLGYAYNSQLRIWQWILGAMVIALAVLQLWQRRRDDHPGH